MSVCLTVAWRWLQDLSWLACMLRCGVPFKCYQRGLVAFPEQS